MYRRFLHLYFVLLAILLPAYLHAEEADKGTIHGKVITEDGQPAPAVSVLLKGAHRSVITSAEGVFVFKDVRPGSYDIEVSFIGYEKKTQPVIVTARETVNVTISISANSLSLQEFNVTSVRSPYKTNQLSSSLRLAEPILEIPQNIQVVSNKVMADQQIISMNDGVLRNVSGATKLEHWGDLYTRVNMRGSRASAFRNGMNVTSTWGPLTEDMSFVDHIEFVKGPAGFMMSNGEPSGIYNVVTKKPTGVSKGEATLTLGSYDLYRGTLDLDGKLDKSGKLLFRLNLMGQAKNSFRKYEYTNRYSIAPVLSYKVNDRTTLTLEYVLQQVKMSNVGTFYVFDYDYATTPRNFTTAEPGLDPTNISDNSLMLNVVHNISKDWKLTAQAAYFNYQQQGTSMWPSAVNKDGTMIRRVSIWDASNEAKFGQLFVNGEIKTGALQHRILAGLDLGNKEYIADWNQGFDLDSNKAFFNIRNPKYGKPVMGLPVFDRSRSLRQRAGTNIINQSYTGVYLQDEIGFWDNKVRLTLAGRFTTVEESSYGVTTTARQVTPRVGLSVNIDRMTSAYTLYDQSFVPQTGILRSGDKVKPITGNNIEFGLKRDWFDGRWNSTVAVYRIIKNNQLSNDPTNGNGENFYLQLGQTKTEGVELEIRGEIIRGLNLVANYAYTDSKISKATKDLAVGASVPGFAKHNANAWLSYRVQQGVLSGFGVSAGFSYMADRSTWAWAGTTTQRQLPDYFKLDGGLSWEKQQFSIAANVYNLLDAYLYSGSPYKNYYYWQAEPGRNLRVTVGYKF
ncbi:MAG TPA: TonB-dependent receptor [Chitinophaga sp.]|uniref:TonB-dependent receptor n=1 Tax=Chitinophaga sp. TaxID=1869181 RepID=UPI002B8D8F01|nr:TonB-dependent receptor [Chitinophaga sp.]HVI46876.1 TonB-dependent receptor [Chitinophaga sp.]